MLRNGFKIDLTWRTFKLLIALGYLVLKKHLFVAKKLCSLLKCSKCFSNAIWILACHNFLLKATKQACNIPKAKVTLKINDDLFSWSIKLAFSIFDFEEQVRKIMTHKRGKRIWKFGLNTYLIHWNIIANTERRHIVIFHFQNECC